MNYVALIMLVLMGVSLCTEAQLVKKIEVDGASYIRYWGGDDLIINTFPGTDTINNFRYSIASGDLLYQDLNSNMMVYDFKKDNKLSLGLVSGHIMLVAQNDSMGFMLDKMKSDAGYMDYKNSYYMLFNDSLNQVIYTTSKGENKVYKNSASGRSISDLKDAMGIDFNENDKKYFLQWIDANRLRIHTLNKTSRFIELDGFDVNSECVLTPGQDKLICNKKRQLVVIDPLSGLIVKSFKVKNDFLLDTSNDGRYVVATSKKMNFTIYKIDGDKILAKEIPGIKNDGFTFFTENGGYLITSRWVLNGLKYSTVVEIWDFKKLVEDYF